MSEQERPSGRPPKPQDFSLPSLGESVESDGRPTPRTGRVKSASRSFDPTQYVQGRPAGSPPDEGRGSRRAPREETVPEELPPPSYQPKQTAQIAQAAPEGTQAEPAMPENDRIYPRADSQEAAEALDPAVLPWADAQPAQSAEAETAGDPRVAGAPPMAKMLNIVGAGTSIALVLGLGFWGYRLAVRDVSGVPIVAALEGPMRIQPEDPGGELATHQGLAVNAVQAVGEAEATADRLVLAPEPVKVREGDGVLTAPFTLPKATTPPTEVRPETPENPETAQATEVAPPDEKPKDAPTPAQETQTDVAVPEPTEVVATQPEVVIQAPPALDVAAAAAQQAVDALADAEVALDKPAEPAVIETSIPGVSASPRPEARPEDFAERVAAQRANTGAVTAPETAQATASPEADADQAAEATVPTVDEIAPESLAVGTNLAQLGAYPSAEIASAEWDKKAAKFEDYMAGKQRVIQRAESGGRAFYRLRVHGFENINEARKFCATLQSEGAECISVVVRE